MNTGKIVTRIAGYDETDGACTSLALVYAGNKCGYNVLDFRGGTNSDIFRHNNTLLRFANAVGGAIDKTSNEFIATNNLLGKVRPNKEYIFSAGEHTAIIRKTEKGIYQYLELQENGGQKSGFHRLTYSVLKDRFDLKKSRTIRGLKSTNPTFLIDIDSLHGNHNFRELLEFINTR